ncbi:hypothetical protein TNCV_4162441 [Trichonephila clavipes]|nr:hypothetical protein TNCV_4162441 [Trichonephila clavipes]
MTGRVLDAPDLEDDMPDEKSGQAFAKIWSAGESFKKPVCNLGCKRPVTNQVRHRGGKKFQRHSVFPDDRPPKYRPCPMMLNFSDQKRTGIFSTE